MSYNWYEKAEMQLDKDLEKGLLSWEQYNKELIELRRELREEEQIRAACEEAYD